MGTALIPYPVKPETDKAKHGNRYTERDFALGLRKGKGNITVAAKIIGCSRKTLSSAVNRSEYLRDVQQQAMGVVVDLSVKGVTDRAERGHPGDQRFVIKVFGPQQGIIPIERREISGPDGGPIKTVADGERAQMASLNDDQLKTLINAARVLDELERQHDGDQPRPGGSPAQGSGGGMGVPQAGM